MDTLFSRIIRQWLPLAVGISAVTFIIYLVIQQDIRIGANDPQIQIAEDTAAALQNGKQKALPETIDVTKSLAPFTIVYDKNGTVISSSANLNGKTPSLPQGTLTGNKGTQQLGENRITWQPEDGVRLATVIVAYDKGYVAVGRNMREIEIREYEQFNNTVLGWVMALVATLSCVVIMQTVMYEKK
jgi:hypothetical protein